MGQADRIKTLLQERAVAFDPSLDVSEGSDFYREVIAPVVDTLSPDPIDTDALEFLRARLAQEYPSMPTGDTDGVIALMAKPMALLLEPYKSEMAHIRAGQSTRNAAELTIEQAKDLAANWNVQPKVGGRSQTTVRVYYSSPRTVNVPRTAIFSTVDGLNFLPTRPQVIRLEAMLAQREGREYYIDVPVIAEKEGSEYDVIPNAISRSSSFPASTRLRNLTKARGGVGGETAAQLLERVETSVTERSLTTSRGIIARLNDEFGGLLRDIVVVGAGDPEMQRDVLTASGGGDVLASGICIIVGQYCLLASQFENRGQAGTRRPVAGDKIDLNYWSFLYSTATPAQRNETFEILDVLLDSRNAMPELPAVLLLKLSGAPSVASPVSATIPGTHPGVFAAVRSRGTIEVSGIPGGILSPTTDRGTLVVGEDQIHLFGHQDVWVRPATVASDSSTMEVYPRAPLVEGRDLSAAQAGTDSGRAARNLVSFDMRVTVSMSVGSLSVGDRLENGGRSVGVVRARDGNEAVLSSIDPFVFSIGLGTQFTTSSGASGTLTAFDSRSFAGTPLDGLWYPDGLVLEILTGPDTGVYKILALLQFGVPTLVLDKDMTDSWYGQSYRISRSASVDIFSPARPILPFAGEPLNDLRTTIGSPTVRTATNVQSAGGQVGDALEILSGPDQGVYRIIGFNTVSGGIAPILNAPMTSSNSGLEFKVYRPSQGVQSPLVRIEPGGVRLLDASGQDTGSTVPYALPLSARPKNGLTGAKLKARGINGFVLPDPGPSWAPTGDSSASGLPGAADCYTEGCAACDEGSVVIFSVTDTGQMYMSSEMPAEVPAFFGDLRQWFLDVIAALGLGAEAAAFVTGLTPIILGDPPGSATVLARYEFCLPDELFDTRANVYVALPEIDWEAEIEKAGSFAGALSRLNLGLLEDGFRPSALAEAVPGDTLTVAEGANRGSYVIRKTTTLRVATAGSIVESEYKKERTYPVTFVVIEGEFPASPLAGLAEFFSDGVPTLSVPAPPAFPFQIYSLDGDLISPWSMIEGLLTFLAQWANAAGLDAPASIVLDEVEALKAVWLNLFSKYSVGRPTAPETMRLRFVEPTSVTLWAPRRFSGLSPVSLVRAAPATITGGPHGLTLPNATLSGKPFKLWVRTAFELFEVSGVLPPSAGTASAAAELAFIVQHAIDTAAQDIGRQFGIGEIRFPLIAGAGTFSISFFQNNEFETSETYLELDVTAGGTFALLGFSPSSQAKSSSAVGGTISVFVRPKAPTRFVGARGAEVVEYVPTPELEWVVYPPAGPGEIPGPQDLPRDLVLIPRDNSDDTTYLAFVDRLFEPSLQSRPPGLQDILRVHQQKRLLDITVPEGPVFQVRDRIVAVITEAGSPVIRLPSMNAPAFTFVQPQSSDEWDVVRVGDLVYIEEGVSAGGYTVVERHPDRLVLDRPLAETTPIIRATGNTGIINLSDGAKKIRIPSGWRRNGSDGDGAHLTIWASPHLNVNGAYPINGIEDQGATLLVTLDTDDDFVFPETGVHWAIAVPATLQSVPSSILGGRSELGCVRPIRIYSGEPDDLAVSFVNASSARRAYMGAQSDTVAVRPSQKPPYSFVKRHAYHISSAAMKAQGRDRGLYWFDVPVMSLGHTEAHNVPVDFHTDAAFGTYESDGYWFEVQDPNLTFSSRERTNIVFSGHFLPSTEEDLWGNRKILTTRSVLVTYDFSPTLDRVQALLVSTSDRNTCADSLARHFCPSYVYLDIDVTGGAPASQVANRLYTRIDSMFATDPLDVSILERELSGATSYTHPIVVQVVTHDLDRRLIESRSSDRIDDETLDANATNRTTFFIPGLDQSSLSEDKVPDGERIVVRRGSGSTL